MVKMVCHTTLKTFGQVAFEEGKTYDFDRHETYFIADPETDLGEHYFTVENDHDGKSYKNWFREADKKTFSQMDKRELQQARYDIVKKLSGTLGSSRATSLTNTGVNLEGGSFPATYDYKTQTLTIWGRGSRYAGASMTVDRLQEAERVLDEIFYEYGSLKEETE